MELTVVVSVLGLDCAQHSSCIAPRNGDQNPLEEELEGTRLPCFCLEAMSQFVEESSCPTINQSTAGRFNPGVLSTAYK